MTGSVCECVKIDAQWRVFPIKNRDLTVNHWPEPTTRASSEESEWRDVEGKRAHLLGVPPGGSAGFCDFRAQKDTSADCSSIHPAQELIVNIQVLIVNIQELIVNIQELIVNIQELIVSIQELASTLQELVVSGVCI